MVIRLRFVIDLQNKPGVQGTGFGNVGRYAKAGFLREFLVNIACMYISVLVLGIEAAVFPVGQDACVGCRGFIRPAVRPGITDT